MFKINDLQEKLGQAPSGGRGRKWLLPTVIAVIFILLLLVAGNALVIFEMTYLEKFYPGSRIGEMDLSGLTRDQAFKKIDELAGKISEQPIQVKYSNNGQEEIIVLDQILNPDSAKDYLSYDVYQTVYDIYNIGRTGGWINRLFNQWLLVQGYAKSSAKLNLDKEYVKQIISGQLADLEVKESDAAAKIICGNGNCQVEILPEADGKSFDYDEALNNWEKGLKLFVMNPINLKQIIVKPKIKKAEADKLVNKVSEFISNSSTPEYYYKEDKWRISKTELAKIIKFERGNGNIYLTINKELFAVWFKDNISKDIDVPAQNAAILVIDGKVTNLSSHKNGLAADAEKAYADLTAKVINQDFNDLRFEIAVKTTVPDVVTENVNDLGIKEILGVGESNFAGSPTNRRKNIKNGASKLQGLLIKPGDEFSLIKTLLPVDASTGYFQELVIKGNKTTAEYGGGLCQIGTTVFRAALASGLPILERQNHSYSVTYYLENGKPGVDATIYDPKPDLRFRNDTGNYILIQSRIVGDKIYFEFWGTKDGRSATRTIPKTWGLKPPPPMKTVESTDLAPGEKKCTEVSHNGISASFDYIVNYPDGKTATTTFTSIYKPWQAVCLVGVVPGAASSTESVTP